MQNIGYLLSGATAEGQGYARQWASNVDKLQDLDLMQCMGEIDNENELIIIPNVPAFVRVKWNNKKLVHLPVSYYGIELDDENSSPAIPLVNGSKMKQYLAEQLKKSPYFPGEKTVATDKAAVETQATMIDPADIDCDGKTFENGLKLIEEERYKPKDKELKNKLYQNFNYYCHQAIAKPSLTTDLFFATSYSGPLSEIFPSLTSPFHLDVASINVNSFLLLSPIFDCRLSADYYHKCRLLLTFYQKYKQFSKNHPMLPSIHSTLKKSFTMEMDYVPALKLNFWPTNMKPFLERLKRHRPSLHEKIKDVYMHLVPKWSCLTSSYNQEFEFRYSLSEVEVILAENRSLKEKCLNGIARSIYYKYLYRETKLTSYIVKTTVLWMCETNDIDEYTQNVVLANRWINYLCKCLKTRHCPHYFIDGLNLFQNSPREDLDKALLILQTKVNLNDRTRPTNDYSRHFDIPVFDDMEQSLSESEEQTIEDLTRTVEEDYKEFQRQWYGTTIETAMPISTSSSSTSIIFDQQFLKYMDLLTILTILGACENEQQTNWSQYMKLVVDYNDQCSHEPIFGDDPTARSNQTVLSFVMYLSISAKLIKCLYDACLSRKPVMCLPLPSTAVTQRQQPTIHQRQERDRSFLQYYTGANITATNRMSSLSFSNGSSLTSTFLGENNKTNNDNNNNGTTILDHHPYNEQVNSHDFQKAIEPLMNYSLSLLQQAEQHNETTNSNSNLPYSQSQVCSIS